MPTSNNGLNVFANDVAVIPRPLISVGKTYVVNQSSTNGVAWYMQCEVTFTDSGMTCSTLYLGGYTNPKYYIYGIK